MCSSAIIVTSKHWVSQAWPETGHATNLRWFFPRASQKGLLKVEMKFHMFRMFEHMVQKRGFPQITYSPTCPRSSKLLDFSCLNCQPLRKWHTLLRVESPRLHVVPNNT